jgi:septal ring factor EnvC (AmiA/AmiB activator)
MGAAEVASVAGAELAAAQEPGGPRGPVDVSWLILQRLDDLRRAQEELRRAQDELRAEVRQEVASLRTDLKALDAKIESVRHESLGLWRWSLALLLVPILGLLAKLLIPGT